MSDLIKYLNAMKENKNYYFNIDCLNLLQKKEMLLDSHSIITSNFSNQLYIYKSNNFLYVVKMNSGTEIIYLKTQIHKDITIFDLFFEFRKNVTAGFGFVMAYAISCGYINTIDDYDARSFKYTPLSEQNIKLNIEYSDLQIL